MTTRATTTSAAAAAAMGYPHSAYQYSYLSSSRWHSLRQVSVRQGARRRRNASWLPRPSRCSKRRTRSWRGRCQRPRGRFENMKIQNDTMLVKHQQATRCSNSWQEGEDLTTTTRSTVQARAAQLKDVMKGYPAADRLVEQHHRHLQQENISLQERISPRRSCVPT